MIARPQTTRGGLGFVAVLLLVLLQLAAPFGIQTAGAQAADPSGAYLQAYIAFQDGGRLEKAGDLNGALRKYNQSLSLFHGVRRSFPTWNPQMVDFRTKKVEESIGKVQSGGSNIAAAPAPPVSVPSNPNPGAGFVPAPIPAAPAAVGGSITDQIQAQFKTYEEQIRQLQAGNQQLMQQRDEQTRLYQESISKIAAAKNQETAARTRIQQLEKEVQMAQTGNSQALAALQQEKTALQAELEKATQGLATANSETSQILAALEESKSASKAVEKERDAAIKERDQMALIVKTYEDGSDDAMKKLVAENGKLQKELQTALEKVETMSAENQGKDLEIAQLKDQVKDVRGQLATIREKASGYVATIGDLETRLKATMQMLEHDGKKSDLPEELLAENQILKGMIRRQILHQTRLHGTNQLVQAELERLDGSSQELIDRVAQLSEERPGLGEAERALLEKYELLPQEGGVEATMIAEVDNSGDTPPAPSPEVPAGLDAKQLASQAEEAFFARDFPKAKAYYEEFAKTDPDPRAHGLALANLGVVCMRMKDFEAAEQALTKARAIQPDNSFVHFNLGMAHYWQGQNDDALLALESATKIDPENLKAHQYTGIAAARIGEYEKAEKGFLEAIALDPRFSPAHFNLAVIYATGEGSKEAYERAEQHYIRAIETGADQDPLLERILTKAKSVAGEEADGVNGG